jgi:hypothetical protein
MAQNPEPVVYALVTSWHLVTRVKLVKTYLATVVDRVDGGYISKLGSAGGDVEVKEILQSH